LAYNYIRKVQNGMFYRKIEEKLYEYYANKDAKILVIDGARQVGKSFIIRNTAKNVFKNYIEVNLKDDFDGDRKYEKINTTEAFYLQLSADYGVDLNNNEDTIVFLDEIQVYSHLLTMLKALKLENRYRYIASGSLLGVTLKHTFIPMGSIEEIKMYPLDFEEYLIARGVKKDVIQYLNDCFINAKPVYDNIHETFLRYFKEYLICGGLPDSVNEFLINKNTFRTRENQEITFSYYKDDATQYDQEHNLKTRRIYDYLVSYMENKVKRIKFKNIDSKKRGNLDKYQDEFDYLIYSGCTLPVKAISNPKFPLAESSSKNLIKLYYNDVGLLSNLLFKNNISALLDQDKGINLGGVYETACAMELIAHGHELYYFDSKKVGEVDFLINDYNSLSVLPIEIKSGKTQNNFRALPKLVKEPYNLSFGYVFGNKNEVVKDGNIYTCPIYMIMFV